MATDKRKIAIAPSLLSADLANLMGQVKAVEGAGADYIHLDVMDGHLVPNLTFGPILVDAVSRITDLPLDVHLMIESPEKYIEAFVNAGADIITVHQEACVHLHRTIQQIKGYGIKAGVSLNPATPVETLVHVLDDIDLVLIMSVNPGFGGQKFIPGVLDKIKWLYDRIPHKLIEVDGGIDMKTAPEVVSAGANILVAGNAIYGDSDPGAALKRLRNVTRP